jgi:preprotein translocase subunit SecB
MADQDPINPNNGSGPQGEPGGEPQIAQIAQYIKDMSVESPNAPAVFQWQVQPQVDIGFNINVNNITDEVHEVILKVSVNAKSENGAHFLIDLSYAGLFGIRNIPDNAIGAFLLVEAPRLLFPFARQVIAESVQNTGFPPLLIEPIDFGAAYVQQLEATQGEQGAGNGNGEEAPPAGDENQG